MLPDIDLERIADPSARAVIVALLNMVEALRAEVRTLREENQRLREEVSRLKGEQGKPEILANVRRAKRPTNHSSEQERREARPPGERRKGVKQARRRRP